MFDPWIMYAGRQDIIGDLFRLRLEIAYGTHSDAEVTLLRRRLDVLAVVAVDAGMTDTLVTKAAGVAPERVDDVRRRYPELVAQEASHYERDHTGAVIRR